MPKLLNNRTAVITGATRGIGRGIAIAFAQSGSNVAFTYRSSFEQAQKLEKELNDLGIKAKGYKSDASSFEGSKKLIEEVLGDFNSIDILVNNAGITKDNLLMRMSEDDFDSVIETNLKSVFNMSSSVQYFFLKQRKGSIINISSIVGLKGNPGQSNYAASKAGIIGFTKSLALELGSRNIRVNVIAPGFIKTEMTDNLSDDIIENWKDRIPLKRIGKPEDIANACIFLASDLSDYVTGQVIQVDGGMLT